MLSQRSALRALGFALLACGLCACGASVKSEGLPGQCRAPTPPGEGELPGLTRTAQGLGGEALSKRVALDSDGEPDLLVSSAERCDRFGNCAYSAYVMRGECGHFVGAFWAHSVRVQEAPGRVVRDLIAKTLGTGAEYEEWYRYDPDQTCVALREKRSYRAGRRDPLADWAAWERCE